MRVRAKLPDEVQIPPEIEPYCRQPLLTGGKEYEVHAIAAWLRDPPMVLFQIIDDLLSPSWLPHILFEIVDRSCAPDWCCNVLEEDGRAECFLLGPEFIVKDVDSYNAMVEHEADQVELFWKRIDAIEKAREEQRWLEELDKQPEDSG